MPQGLIIACQACSVGPDPERARVIGKHGGQPVGRNTRGIVFGVAVMLKTTGFLVVRIQTATISSNPDLSLAIFGQLPNFVRREATLIPRVRLVMDELPAGFIKAINTGIKAADP